LDAPRYFRDPATNTISVSVSDAPATDVILIDADVFDETVAAL
jgi:hypothetical protein